MRPLGSALFWKILLSSLVVVGVLGVALGRAQATHEELDRQFERLVQHDLRLADDAEVLLRLLADLETGKRGFLLTRSRTFLTPYEEARADLDHVLAEAQSTAENGMEDERVSSFGRIVREWIATVSEPQIHLLENNPSIVPSVDMTAAGTTKTDEARALMTELRDEVRHAADAREDIAFQTATRSRQQTTALLVLSIIIALGSGIWIARDVASATALLEEGMVATSRLEPLPNFPARRDELGTVGRSLQKMAEVLVEKDASLRSTLADRERTLNELRAANLDLEGRDANARLYAEFVRELKTLDIGALTGSGVRGLVKLARAQLAVVYLLDGADRLASVHAETADGRPIDHHLFSADGFPRTIMERREPAMLRGELGDSAPTVDFGLVKSKVRWLLAQPIAVGTDSAGALLLAGTEDIPAGADDLVRDGARQLAVGLHNAWAHERLTQQSLILKEQGEILARANKVKTDFLASMSHELRTPLSAILGFADLLLGSSKESLSARARDSLTRIKWNGDHLLSLINDVLDLAKVESGRVDVRRAPVNIAQLARACVAEVDSLRAGKDVTLTADVPDQNIEVLTDAQRVRQVLLNLLSNALKFTDRGDVKLSVRTTANDVILQVSDTGIGIAAHALGELFQDFHQLHAGDGRRFAGTGVGLALSRRLARALGGDIEASSRENQGSAFTLTLPRTVPSAAILMAEELAAPASTPIIADAPQLPASTRAPHKEAS